MLYVIYRQVKEKHHNLAGMTVVTAGPHAKTSGQADGQAGR